MITATNATKRFEDITAVDHICAEVKDGSVYGLIGSNGAGTVSYTHLDVYKRQAHTPRGMRILCTY